MPSTLAHIALQAPVTTAFFGRRALPWALIGCVVPDLAWIFQRAIKWTWRGDQEIFYDLRYYAAAQASLAASALLCLGLSALAIRARATFAVLIGGCVLHLLFDATQLRWGNGVHLLLPLDGHAWAPGSVGPDHLAFQLVSLVGAAVLFRLRSPELSGGELLLTPARLCLAGACTAGFLLLPLVTMGILDRADSHSVRTLRAADRTGLRVELYRAHYFPAADSAAGDGEQALPFVLTMASEPLRIVSGLELPHRARVSVRATFVDHDSLAVDDHHLHLRSRRSLYSIVGLLGISWLVGRWLVVEVSSHSATRGRRRS